MPLCFHFSSCVIYTDGDEETFNALPDRELKRLFSLPTMNPNKKIIINRDQVLFVEYLSVEEFKRLNEMMKRSGGKILRAEIDPLKGFNH